MGIPINKNMKNI